MFCVMFSHDVAYVRVGCTDNVWATYNGNDQDECLRALALSQVQIGTFGELERLKGQVMEWYVRAQDARR